MNTFTGSLVIQDTPVSYKSVGDGFPFTITYDSSTGQSGSLGPHWNHSYNVSIADSGSLGATVVEGNSWERPFALVSGNYVAPVGVMLGLTKTYNGSTWTGWQVTRPNQQSMTFNTSRPTHREDRLPGLTWSFSYTSGLLTTVTDPMGRQTTLSYTNGYLTKVTLPGNSGNVYASFAYDSSNRLHTVTDAAGYTYTYGYDSSNRVTSLVDPSGREIDYTYNSSGQLYTICTYGISSSLKTYTYTPQTNGQLYTDLVETKSGVNRDTRWIYDNTSTDSTYGMLLSKVVDEGGSGNLNLTQAWAYDSQCRKIKFKDSCQTDPGGKAHITFYSYTDSNNPTRSPSSWTRRTRTAIPPSGTCPGYVYTYDGNGNKLSEVTPQGRETDYAYYSGTNRLYTKTLKDKDRNGNSVNRVTTYTYYGSTKAYQVDTVTDACSNVTTYDYSTSTGYRISMTPQVGNATTYGYNDMGDTTSVTDGNNNTTSYQYDNIHRQTQISYPDVGNGQKTKTTTWTCCGKTSETDENGVVTKYYYDEDQTPAVHDHRLWKVVQDYGTGTLNYTTQYGYDEVGNNTTVINPRGYTTTYTYDAGNRKTQASYPDSTSESWTYADNGRGLDPHRRPRPRRHLSL